MLRINARLEDAELQLKLQRLELAVSDASFDKPIDKAGNRALREIVLKTPKKWTGETRKSWQLRKPYAGTRILFNASKIMSFLEGGTGLSTGGYIYPRFKKRLFVPLTRRAALAAPGSKLKYGTDYVLAKRVKGIQAKHIVENFKPRAQEILHEEMSAFLKEALK
jgi:hypothetical protein